MERFFLVIFHSQSFAAVEIYVYISSRSNWGANINLDEMKRSRFVVRSLSHLENEIWEKPNLFSGSQIDTEKKGISPIVHKKESQWGNLKP